MSTTIGTLITLDDVLTEGTDGQYVEVDLADAAGAINTAAIVGITGALRSLDTEELIFPASTDLLAAPARASYSGGPTSGRVRVTFTAADLVAKGSRELQQRELTLRIIHSGTKVFNCAVRFGLGNLRDAT